MDKVLIVDFNPDTLAMLSEGLRKYKGQFDVLTASDKKNALGLLSQERISVLVLDLGTPKNSGLELLAQICIKHPRMPCIAVIEPSVSEGEKRKNAPPAGVFQCIEKPVDVNSLAGLILAGLECLDEGMFWKGSRKLIQNRNARKC